MRELDILQKHKEYPIEACECDTNLKRELKNKEKLINAIFQVANIGVCVTDEKGFFQMVNEVYCKLYGYNREELIGKHFTIVIPEENHDNAIRAHEAFISGEVEVSNEWSVITKDGRLLSVYVTSTLLEQEDGEKCRVTTITDVTEFKEAYNKLNLVSYALSTANDGVIFTSTDPSDILYVNEAMMRITGFSKEELVKEQKGFLKSGPEDSKFYEDMWHQVENHGFWQGEIRGVKKSKEEYVAELALNKIMNSDGQVTNYIANLNEITEKKRVEKKIHYLATYSSITNLPNRQFYESAVSQVIKAHKDPQGKVAMIMVDLDRFKNINDSYGFSMGNKLLRAVAYRIKNILKGVATVAYLGEDHFGILLDQITGMNNVCTITQKIKSAIGRPFVFDKNYIYITCSMGVSFYRRESKGSEDLISHAEKAILKAKNQGGNCMQVYTLEMDRKLTRRAQIENDLKTAIYNNELFLVYQPQVELLNEKLVGVEALLRWKHPTLGMISPDEFIPIAEETGAILSIGQWVIKTAAIQAKQWELDGLPVSKVAVNLSSVQLKHDNICMLIKDILQQVGLSPESIEIELTETTMMEDIGRSIDIFNTLKEMGLKIAVDDFGTGYSSLSYLRKIPINKLKIDRSFIMDLETDFEESIITKTIIHMGKNLGFKVIAEGVETKEQMQYLRENGCDEAQGYYYSKPLTQNELKDFIINHYISS